MPFRFRTLGVLLVFVLPSITFGKDLELKLRWPDLPKSLEGQKVRIFQRDQQATSGILTRIEPNGLMLEGRSGPATIAQDTVARIETKTKAVRRRSRIIGTAIGTGPGIIVLSFALTYQHNEVGSNSGAIVGSAVGAAAGATVLGYLAGRSSDSDKTVVQILQSSN